METVNQILKILEDLSKVGTGDLIVRIIFILLGVVGGLYWAIMKRKARKAEAERQAQSDRQDNVSDNERDEDQNHQDGSSIRDRLRRKE